MLDTKFEAINDEIKAIRLMLSGDSATPGHADDLVGIDLRVKWIEECLNEIRSSISLMSKLLTVMVVIQIISLIVK